MADRTVKVSLILAAQGFASGMDQVQQKIAKTGSDIDKLNQKRQAFTQLGAAAVGMGAAFGVGVGLAVSKFAEFDQQMSYVQARTHETAANMDLLREAALDAGARTVFSATESAAAIEELAAAGVSTADILAGGLDAALDLAAAGGLDVAEAAGIAATQLQVFKLRGEDMSHVADLLAAGAGKAMGEVTDLSSAMAQGGQVAAATGLSIEETTAALSAFAAQGLLGSDAGTSFKSMLQRLTPQSQEAQREMDRLGISAYDASGNFVGLASFAGNLQDALRDLTPEQRNAALATIFGSDAVRAANVIYEEGTEGILEWTDAVNDQGYAAETAAMRLDNLMGDVEALGGAFDTALIQSGSGANDALRSLTQTATGAVDMFNALPAPVQEAAVYLGMAATAVGLVGGAALIATPRVAEFKAIVNAAGFSLKGLSLAAGAATIGLAAVMGIVAAVATAQAEAAAKAEAYADAIDSGADSVRELAEANLQVERTLAFLNFGSAYDNADKLGISLNLVTDAVSEGGEALEELSTILDTATGGGEAAQQMADDLGISYLDLAQSAGTLREQVDAERDAQERANVIREQAARATEESSESSQTAAEAYLDAASGAEDLRGQLEQLIDTVNEANGVGQDAISANLNYKDALADVDQAIQDARDGVEGYALTLDTNTEAGRNNMGMLVGLAQDAQKAAEAQYALDGNTDSYRTTLESSRQALIDRATDLGYNADQAEALADQIFRIPDETEWEVIADTQQATSAAEAFVNRWQGKTITMSMFLDTSGGNVAAAASAARYTGYAQQYYSQGNYSGNLYEKGQKVKAFEGGGFASGFYAGRPGGIHKFAEENLPWELYVSPHPGYLQKNRELVWEAGTRLGMWRPAPDTSGTGAREAAAAPAFSPTVTVQALPGMSPQEQAAIVVEELRWMT